MLYLTKNYMIITVCKGLLLIILVFGVFTGIQIWRNSVLINGYQLKRSIYMDKLMKITSYDEAEKMELTNLQNGIATLIENSTGMPITKKNETTILSGGSKVIDEIIEAFSQAEHHIHVEFFIIRDDEIGKKFKDILIKKTQEGVKVRLIYDGLGSTSFSTSFKKELLAAGVEIGVFDNTLQSILKGKLNNRNHRKIVIVDGRVAFTGGFNIGDEYLGRDDSIGEWHDMHVMIEGEAVNWIQKIFLADWFYITSEAIIDERYFAQNNTEAFMPIQMISSGFDTHWNEISQLYFSMISNAQEKVYITTPYLILNDSLIKALQTAALRGVDVKIILPKKPDLFLVGWANTSFFEKLLKAKVEIYLHEDGFIHSKVILTDNQIVSIGSANFNTRSLFLDYEVNAVIFNEDKCKEVEAIIHDYLKNSHSVAYEDYKKVNIATRLKLWIGRLIIPLA